MFRQPLLTLLLVTSAAASDSPREILWDQLVPEGWNPYALFDELSVEEIDALSDEEYFALQEKAQEMLDKAPLVEELDGETVKIPGFVLPLEYDGTRIREFLLMPYLGACLHTPPPPANQVIRGSLAQPHDLQEMWHPVWILGRLKTGHATNKLEEEGYDSLSNVSSGYSMDVESIEPYTQREPNG